MLYYMFELSYTCWLPSCWPLHLSLSLPLHSSMCCTAPTIHSPILFSSFRHVQNLLFGRFHWTLTWTSFGYKSSEVREQTSYLTCWQLDPWARTAAVIFASDVVFALWINLTNIKQESAIFLWHFHFKMGDTDRMKNRRRFFFQYSQQEFVSCDLSQCVLSWTQH